MSVAPRNDELFELHVLPEIDVLYRVARSLTCNAADAEDLVQDTLVRAFRAVDRFDGRHRRSWLLTIMRNTHINRNRRRRPQLMATARGAEELADKSCSSDVADVVADRSLGAELERALADLDEPFRRVIELVDIAGLTYAETAAALDIPTGTVMSRLHRGRKSVRDRLGHTGLVPRGS
jgi:RNA polymerase sigma-70 factor (ECF subfamily)